MIFGIDNTLEGLHTLGQMLIIVKLLDLIVFYFLVRWSIVLSVLNFFPCSFSDHDFVTLIFSRDYGPSTRGGVWKFNSSLLSDAIFIRD